MRAFLLFFLGISLQGAAQTDTTYQYFDKDWKTTSKENAYFYAKIVKENKNWHRQDFWVNGNIMQMDAWYEDATTEVENGTARFYTEKGILRDSNNYSHGKLLSKYIFYEDHSIKGFGIYNDEGDIIKQAGYEPNGKIIEGYIFQQEATFPGGIEAWQEYLIKSLNKNQPKAYKQGKINGTVVVTFLVDKEGNVNEVQLGTSSGHTELDEHAMNIIRNSPKWNPAIQYNQKVIYRQKQSLTYSN